MAQYHIYVNVNRGASISSFIALVDGNNWADGEWTLEYAAPGYYFETNNEEIQDFIAGPAFNHFTIEQLETA